MFFFRCFDFGNEAPVNSRRVTEIGTVKETVRNVGMGLEKVYKYMIDLFNFDSFRCMNMFISYCCCYLLFVCYSFITGLGSLASAYVSSI